MDTETKEKIDFSGTINWTEFDRKYQAQKVEQAAAREQERLEKRDWIDTTLDVVDYFKRRLGIRTK